MVDMKKCIQTLVGKPDGKKPFARAKGRWEDNIRMDLWEIAWKGGEWMHLAQDRGQWGALMNTIMNVCVP
jgi:hypothetical protein